MNQQQFPNSDLFVSKNLTSKFSAKKKDFSSRPGNRDVYPRNPERKAALLMIAMSQHLIDELVQRLCEQAISALFEQRYPTISGLNHFRVER